MNSSRTARPRPAARRPGGVPLAALAQARAAAYRLLAHVFLEPDLGWVRTVPAVARTLRARPDPLRRLAVGAVWRQVLDVLAGLGEAHRDALEAEYVAAFLQEPASSPGEAAYAPREATAALLADLERRYARAGFAVDPAAAVGPDHVAVELEFLGVLCGREAEAWTARDPGAARAMLREEREFLETHPARWLPAFARQLAPRGGCYAQAARVAAAFVVHDRDLVSGLLGCPLEVLA